MVEIDTLYGMNMCELRAVPSKSLSRKKVHISHSQLGQED